MSKRMNIPPNKDIEWIKAHGDSYAGKWVALLNGVLIASDDTLPALSAWLKLAGIPRQSLMITNMVRKEVGSSPDIWMSGWPSVGHVSVTWSAMEQARRNGHLSYTV